MSLIKQNLSAKVTVYMMTNDGWALCNAEKESDELKKKIVQSIISIVRKGTAMKYCTDVFATKPANPRTYFPQIAVCGLENTELLDVRVYNNGYVFYTKSIVDGWIYISAFGIYTVEKLKSLDEKSFNPIREFTFKKINERMWETGYATRKLTYTLKWPTSRICPKKHVSDVTVHMMTSDGWVDTDKDFDELKKIIVRSIKDIVRDRTFNKYVTNTFATKPEKNTFYFPLIANCKRGNTELLDVRVYDKDGYVFFTKSNIDGLYYISAFGINVNGSSLKGITYTDINKKMQTSGYKYYALTHTLTWPKIY